MTIASLMDVTWLLAALLSGGLTYLLLRMTRMHRMDSNLLLLAGLSLILPLTLTLGLYGLIWVIILV